MNHRVPQLLDLDPVFDEINQLHFDGFLDRPVIRWNPRLRSSAGRFIPGSRRYWLQVPPVIEIANYLMQEPNFEELVRDTLGHEMIHYWLWVRKRPYGHSREFWEKMKLMGVSRYNPVPRTKPPRYLYRCPSCEAEFPARRRLGVLACATCCKRHSKGKFDVRFTLYLEVDQRERRDRVT